MKISKEKRYHLILVAIGSVGVIAGLWFGLIAMQQGKIASIYESKQHVRGEIDKVQKVAVGAPELSKELKASTTRLHEIESGMPSGDLYSWIVSAIREFNTPGYKVDLPQFGPPQVTDVRMLPNFPYNQAIVSVSGYAYYYDFGKFIADLENHFPYLRVQNVTLDPGIGTTPEEREKLSFRMELVMLVKTNAP